MPTPGETRNETMIVQVTDGFLTINGLGGYNSKINYIDIVESTGSPTSGTLVFSPGSISSSLETGTSNTVSSTLSGTGAGTIGLVINDNPSDPKTDTDRNDWLILPATASTGSFDFAIDAVGINASQTRSDQVIATAKGFAPVTLNLDLTVTAPNQLPTADAGPDQTVIDTDDGGDEAVTLDGSASTDSDGTIATYSWVEGVTEIATGVNPTITLSLGVHTIVLTVTDDEGATATDEVVITVNAPAVVACSPISTLECSEIPIAVPFTLNFNGLEGGLEDNNTDQTGFTMVMHPSAPIADAGTPANSNVPGYVPAKLDVNGGNLVITSSKGLFYRDPSKSNNTNSQINGLGVGVDASSGKLRFKTTIVNPAFNLSSNNSAQQAGIWFGIDEDNVVKVALAKTSNTTAKVQLAVEDYATDGNSSAPPEINSADLAGNITTQSVTLILEIDQTTGQAQAFYQLNGGTEVLVENDDDNFLPLGAHFFTGTDHDASGATPNISFGGIYSSIRNASATPAIDFSFSDFSIEVPALSDQKDMLTFVLADQTGPATIDAGAATVAIEVDNGTGLTSLSPTITISDDATISPTSGTPQDFSSAVTYTVTAQDGSTKDWTVNVTEAAPLSDQKDMLTFVLADQTGPATIDAGAATVAIEVDNGTGLTSLSPTITISDDATISPTSGTPSGLLLGSHLYRNSARWFYQRLDRQCY